MAKKVSKKNPKDFLFLACLFLGLGIGFIYNNAAAGAILGLGVGFFAASIYTQKK